MSITATSSLGARLQRLARSVHSLGVEPLAYLLDELVRESSGALDRIEDYARLGRSLPLAGFLQANTPQPPAVWRLK
jgi:hypothetical protein